MQLNMPSVVHAVPAAIAEPVPVVLVLAGAAEDATTVALVVALEAAPEAPALDAGAELATGLMVSVGYGAGGGINIPGAADVATVTNTPPCPGDEAAELALAEVALDAAAEVTAVATEPEPAEATTLDATAALVTPQDGPEGGVGVAVAVPSFSRESPGLGKARSWESAVRQSVLGIFATNMSGRALYAAVSRSTNWV
jgi:hypothetical protein